MGRVCRHEAIGARRTWYPDLIVVGIFAGSSKGDAARKLLSFTISNAISFVDNHYRTKHYATKRAICGYSIGGSSVAYALDNVENANLFSYFLLCSPAREAVADGSSCAVPKG